MRPPGFAGSEVGKESARIFPRVEKISHIKVTDVA